MIASASESAVSADYASSLFEYLRAQGLPEGVESAAAIPVDRWLGLLEQAIHATGDPGLPLKLGESFRVKHLGLVGYVMMTCNTLREVVAQSSRYNHLVGGIGGAQLVERGAIAELRCVWAHDPPAAAIEAVFLAATASLARWMSDRPDLRWDAHFRCDAPRDLAHHARIFRGEIHFGEPETKLVFPASYLALPVAMANPEIHSLVVAQAEELLGDQTAEPVFLGSVKGAITRDLAANRVSLASVARALGMSTRTLHRRLDEHGRSFRDVINEVRRARAEAYLQTPAISLAEVAFLLGYSEQSTFQHAFKRWSGETPGEFRERQLGR